MIQRYPLLTSLLLFLAFLVAPALSDVIKLTDGRHFNVKIVGETEDGVSVRYNDQEFVVAPDQFVWARHTPHRLTVRGREVLAPGGVPIVLRGFNVWSCDPHTRSDFEKMKSLGANHVRLFVYQDWEGVSDRGGPSEPLSAHTLQKLDEIVSWCEDLEIWVVFTVASERRHEGKAGDLFAPETAGSPRRDEFDEIWKVLIERYKTRWFVGMYDIVNEVDDGEPPLTPEELAHWHRARIRAIRAVDPLTPVVISPTGWANIDMFWKSLYLEGLDNVVYSFHYYQPARATSHKEPHEDMAGEAFRTKDGKHQMSLGPQYHAYHFDKARDFSTRFNVPIYLGEFGCWKFKPHCLTWIKDVTQTAEERGFHWSFFCWRGAYGYGVIWTGDNRSFHENTALSAYFDSVMH